MLVYNVDIPLVEITLLMGIIVIILLIESIILTVLLIKQINKTKKLGEQIESLSETMMGIKNNSGMKR